MVDLHAPKLLTGKVLRLGSALMTTGTVLEAIDNTALTTGKLVHLKTNSTVATNPVLMEFKELTTGKAAVLHVDGLTDGVGFEINTNSGDALAANGKVVSIVANSEKLSDRHKKALRVAGRHGLWHCDRQQRFPPAARGSRSP